MPSSHPCTVLTDARLVRVALEALVQVVVVAECVAGALGAHSGSAAEGTRDETVRSAAPWVAPGGNR